MVANSTARTTLAITTRFANSAETSMVGATMDGSFDLVGRYLSHNVSNALDVCFAIGIYLWSRRLAITEVSSIITMLKRSPA